MGAIHDIMKNIHSVIAAEQYKDETYIHIGNIILVIMFLITLNKYRHWKIKASIKYAP